MAVEATKKEWSELYTFLRLLADGEVALGTVQGKPNEEHRWPIALIQRSEHDGLRQYIIKDEAVVMQPARTNPDVTSSWVDKEIPRQKLNEIAQLILSAIKQSSEDTVISSFEVEEFLNLYTIYDFEAATEDRTDLSIAFWSINAPLVGFSVRSRLSTMNRLLDGGRTANLKFEQIGVKFSSPAVSNINASSELPTPVLNRMLLIERLGGGLKYADVADRVFRCNLQMIDLHFPRLLAEMVRTMYLEGIIKVSELTKQMHQINPLKIKDELIDKHKFYEFKVKQFLLALALGMRPAKIYNGTDSAIEGILLVTGSGEVLCYHKSEKQVFEDFLFNNTRFEQGSVEKDKYGFLEKENGLYYFKLNAKIGLSKR